MMKRKMRKLLFLVVMFCIIPNATAATSGDWEYTVNGADCTITGYSGGGGDITIPSSLVGYNVTAIGYRAFYYDRSLTSVDIPNVVTSIEDEAFVASTLTIVNIPDSVTAIGKKAFGSSYLTSVNVSPSNLYYTDINGILFDKNITSLIKYPPKRVDNSYIIPDTVEIILDHAFSYSYNLSSVTIPDGVETIGDFSFYYCTSLQLINTPSSLTSIGDYAFTSTALQSINIPNSVSSIGDHAFYTCHSLNEIVVSEENLYYCDVDGVLFDKEIMTLINYPEVRTGDSYIIPATVTNIIGSAFSFCDILTSVSIPPSVMNIGNAAFGYCDSLASATFKGNAPTVFGSSVFKNASPEFKVYFSQWASGFTEPTWNGYPSESFPAPNITSTVDQMVEEDVSLTITPQMLNVTDEDNIWPNDHTVEVLIGDNYTISGTAILPDLNFNGLLAVNVRVNDGTYNSVPKVINVTVSPVNDAPVISSTTPQIIDEDFSLDITTAMLSVTDVDTSLINHTVIILSGENYTFDGSTITPSLNFNGELAVNVQVNDNESENNLSNQESISVTVNAVNDAPVISSTTPQIIDEDFSLVITSDMLTVTDVDNSWPDDHSIIVLPGSNYSFTGTTITPSLNFNGELSVNVKVNDGALDSITTSIAVTVNAVNDAPVLSKPTNVTVNEDAHDKIINLTAVNVDSEDVLVYSAESDNTDLVTVSVVGAKLTIDFQENAFGEASVTVVVDDGSGESNATDTKTFTVTVNPVNDQPVLTKPLNVYAVENDESIVVSLAATDIEEASLSFSAVSSNPSLVTVSVVDTALTISFQQDTFGSTNITVTVDDNSGETNATASQVFQVSVKSYTINLLEELDVENIDLGNWEYYEQEIVMNQELLDIYPEFYQGLVNAVNLGESALIHTIHPGWNMICCPFEGWSAFEITGTPAMRQLFYYDAFTASYETAFSTYDVKSGRGLWIYVSPEEFVEADEIPYLMTGYYNEQTEVESHIGWNLIGALSPRQEVILPGALMYSWDGPNQYYSEHTGKAMELGTGYWAFFNLPPSIE